MHQLLSVLKISSKFIYKQISQEDYENHHENIVISINKTFINHIHNKARTDIELAERCAMMPLIPTILRKGSITEVRDTGDTRISFAISKRKFSCILNKKAVNEYALISCFIDIP